MKQGKLLASLFTQKNDTKNDSLGFMSGVKRSSAAGGIKTPRQTASDRKWEGAAWISPEQLASSVDKRPRRKGIDPEHPEAGAGAGAVAEKVVAAPAASTSVDAEPCIVECNDPPRPPRPPEPTNGKDVDGRRRDKDKRPSNDTWAWSDTVHNWVQVPRPRVLEVGIFFSYNPIPSKQVVLLEWLHVGSRTDMKASALNADFLRAHLIPRLNRTHPVSLRLLDWLVVDYAREKGIAYRRFFPHLKQYRLVVIYSLYFEWLTRWRRRHYDVFRRRHRIYFTLDGQTYSTTVAQLHFFYMAELYGFLDFAQENAGDIEAHMQSKLGITNAIKRKAAETGEVYRRRPLVNKCPPKAYIAEGECTLTFKIDSDDDGDVEESESDEDDGRVGVSDEDEDENENEGEGDEHEHEDEHEHPFYS